MIDVAGGINFINEYANQDTDTVKSAISFWLGANVENLILTGNATDGFGNELNNTLTGNEGNNHLYGNAGNDTLYGNGGSDVLDGGFGKDTMKGGADDDIYYVDNAGDQVVEKAGEGNDTVYVSFTLSANVENLILWPRRLRLL